MYAGNIGKAQKLSTLLKSVKKLNSVSKKKGSYQNIWRWC